MEVRQCSRVDCLKRRLQRPAKEKGGREGSRQVIEGEVRRDSWTHIEHLSVIILVCIDLMCVDVYVSLCECV